MSENELTRAEAGELLCLSDRRATPVPWYTCYSTVVGGKELASKKS